MTAAQPRPTEEAPEEPSGRPAAAEGGSGRRSAMAASAVAAVVGALLLTGGILMRVPEASGFLGPRFFPLVVGALLLATAVASAAQALGTAASQRTAAHLGKPAEQTAGGAPGSGTSAAPRSDWRTLAAMAATLTAHVVLLEPAGWLLAGTLLFWGVSCALDRRRPLLDLCIAAALAGVVQIVFSGLLDVTLPAGVLGKVL